MTTGRRPRWWTAASLVVLGGSVGTPGCEVPVRDYEQAGGAPGAGTDTGDSPTTSETTGAENTAAGTGGEGGTGPGSGGEGGGSTVTPSGQPYGIYALGNSAPPSSEILALPFVDGYAMRTGWKTLEPQPGQYDFSVIDQVVAALEPSGRHLTLIIFAIEVPSYVLSEPGVETYMAQTPSGLKLTAVSWDDTALTRWEAFTQALAEHQLPDASQPGAPMVAFRDHPVLRQIDSPIVGLQGVRDIGGKLVGAPGYSRDLFVEGTVRSVRAMVDAFPSDYHYMSFFKMTDDIPSPPLDETLLDVLMEEFNATEPTLGFFQETLACDTPGTDFAFSIYDTQGQTYGMFQMLQGWMDPFQTPQNTNECLTLENPNDPSSATAGPDVGIQYGYETFGVRYFELYAADLLHPGFADELTTWHEVLIQP